MSYSESESSISLGGFRRQCLFAVTILLVEDSRSASEAIRLFAAESGARVRRADSLHSASRHLAIYRPKVVMVDLGLPDGDGISLIRHLASASTPLDGIIALSGHDRDAWQDEALAAGAAACLEKPIASFREFQETILSVLPDADRRRSPDDKHFDLTDRASVQAALVEDMQRAHGLLDEAMIARDEDTIAYCAQFLGSIGQMLGDADLVDMARSTVEDAGVSGGLMMLLSERMAMSAPDVVARGVA